MKLETKLKHTRAPWHVDHDAKRTMVGSLFIQVKDEHNVDISDIYLGGNSDMNEANARLIAAAPELLDALMQATLLLKHAHDDANALDSQFAVETADEMTAALTKAIGETQE